MIQHIRTSKLSKIIASYLALQMILTVIHPSNLFAMTSGPSQPEFNSFTPIGTSDMVNLSTGDFNYNIPIMDVGGYPLNLSYDSGVTLDQEASWVGLGWNLNVGQINRQVRGIPDDFKGDEIIYEDNIKDNKTVGMTFNINPQFFGLGDVGLGVNGGITLQHNNYNGVSFKPSVGISFDITNQLSAGAQLSSSATDGASFNPSLSISQQIGKSSESGTHGLGSNIGVGYNSRQGLSSFSFGASYSLADKDNKRIASDGNSAGVSFVNPTFTPRNRTPYYHKSASFAASLGGDVFGIDAEFGVTGFGMVQKLYDPTNPDSNENGIRRTAKSFGYNNTHLADANSVLDYNNEKEDIVSKNTLVLPVTNYTHDLFQIRGQGISGSFRPFRSQVGYLYHNNIQDASTSSNFGGEFEAGSAVHVGFDFNEITGYTRTGVWDSPVLDYFEKGPQSNESIDYEEVYYKSIGELKVDKNTDIYTSPLGATKPIRIGLGGVNHSFGRFAKNVYEVKGALSTNPEDGSYDYVENNFTDRIKRNKRDLRNQTIIPVTKEVSLTDPLFNSQANSAHAKSHHLAGYKILNPDGARYVYGETVYNNNKEEITFAVDKNISDLEPWERNYGVVPYTPTEISRDNNSGRDNFFNRIKTPPYAHTFLLTSVLSADYEDISNDGPTMDDLGSYTKFNYRLHESDFSWKTPFYYRASFNEGLYTDKQDQKGSIIKGEKELKYIHTIETKTHVAYFKLSNRKDGKSPTPDQNTQKIEKIYLFSRPRIQGLVLNGDLNNIEILSDAILENAAIKIANFVYDYDLCRGLPSNDGSSPDPNDPHELANQDGKLTLKELYFTYQGSKMGKYTPYKFDYSSNNYAFRTKAQDIWGNYKPSGTISPNLIGTSVTPQEFPYVQQEDKTMQDNYASSWSLSKIDLPSGGTIEIDYETDDYQYVQDKRAMQMFKVVGITKKGEIPSPSDVGNNLLYTPGNNYNEEGKYLIVALNEDPLEDVISNEQFINRYIGDQINQPIYFRFLLNMSKPGGLSSPPNASNREFDYITGYFQIGNTSEISVFRDDTTDITYGAIPVQFTDLESGFNATQQVNPISKAGWYFGRKFLQRQMLGLPIYSEGTSFKDMVVQLGEDFSSITELFSGINQKLRNEKLIARRFVPERSWIRLIEPTGTKLGGGARVKEVKMFDNWDDMMTAGGTSQGQFYGQQYSYSLDDGTSSGVASYEPNMSKENPLVMPFYNEDERLIAPRELNYVEKPFGESFFPSASVTYSRVEVKNLERNRITANGSQTLRKHATGKVVNEFYTSKDFPTIVDYTDLNGPNNWASNEDQVLEQTITGLLGLEVRVDTELTLSQGFSVQTNDMDGKPKSQEIYNEMGQFISGVDYKYSVDEEGKLDNFVNSIDADGVVNNNSEVKELGVHYEVVNFFNENYTESNTMGVQTNVVVYPPPLPLVIPMVVPNLAQHKNTLHTVTTTKVIHKTGILKEKIAYDLGSTVSTENIAWDELTGQVLLTKTDNEYKDNYYNFSYPSYWYYEGMGLASQNIGITGTLEKQEEVFGYTLQEASTILFPGDELWTSRFDENDQLIEEKLWVISNAEDDIQLMDKEGNAIAFACEPDTIEFKIIRSGYRNLQQANMASVTSRSNPYAEDNEGNLSGSFNGETYNYNYGANTGVTNPTIINSSAVDYSEGWISQYQNNLPILSKSLFDNVNNIHYGQEPAPQTADPIDPREYGFNPYLYNVRGLWRAKKSRAYLTGREGVANNGGNLSKPETRNMGYLTQFNPFYTRDDVGGFWRKSYNNWTTASYVTQYSPYGAELENKDALGRYSTAQYGYNYTLPVAVVSNSQYNEMAFDGFEDYYYQEVNSNENNPHFKWVTELGVSDSNEEAHTGRKSLKVSGQASIVRDYDQGGDALSFEDPDCLPLPPDCMNFPGINFSENTGSIIINNEGKYEGTYRILDAAEYFSLFSSCPQNHQNNANIYNIYIPEIWYVDGDDIIFTVTFDCDGSPNQCLDGSIVVGFNINSNCSSNCVVTVPISND